MSMCEVVEVVEWVFKCRERIEWVWCEIGVGVFCEEVE